MPPKSFLIVLLCVQVVMCYNFQDGGLLMMQQHQNRHNHRHHRILDNSHHPSFRHEHHRHHLFTDGPFPPPSLPLIGSTSSPHPQMHHLRHHNKQKQTWEKRVFPALRTLQTISTSTIDPLTMTTTAASVPPLSTASPLTTASPSSSLSTVRNKLAIQSNYSRRFFDPDEFNSKSSSSSSLRRAKDLNKTTYKFDPYALPLSDKPHFEFPVKKDVVKSELSLAPSSKPSSMMKKAAWDVDEDDDNDGDVDVDEGDTDDNDEEDAVAVLDDESLPDRGDNYDLRDRHKMLNDEIYGLGTGSDNNRRGSRSSKHLQEHLSYNNRNNPGKMHKQHRKHTYHEERKKAQQHFNRVAREINCEIPKPKVVHVQLDPSKSYVPSCTILHRCGDDTGCCKNTKTCQPIQKENVDLYFTVTVHSGNRNEFTFEKISFENHTKCGCRGYAMEDDMRNKNSINHMKLNDQPAQLNRIPDKYGIGIGIRDNYYQTSVVAGAKSSLCTCPDFFDQIIDRNGKCRCDCTSNNTACIRLKKGKEHFSIKQRRCILDGICSLPTCDNGKYLKEKGGCPRSHFDLF